MASQKVKFITSVAPLYSRTFRIFSTRNSPKALRNLRRDYHQAVAIQSLLRPFSVISTSKHCVGGGGRGFSIMSSGGGGSGGNQVVEFRLSASSVLKIQKGDITTWSVDGSSDAIVNPANERMLGGGGADGAIHRAAGPELRAACYDVPEVRPGVRCPTGEARITPGFRLPASHVIHTVGPIYDMDKKAESETSLRNAYRNSLRVAKENSIQYIAFTAISCGVYGYPYDEAAAVAISTIMEFAKDFKEGCLIRRVLRYIKHKFVGISRKLEDFKEVHFVLFSDEIYDVWLNKANELLQK